jgi:hypothetical protein
MWYRYIYSCTLMRKIQVQISKVAWSGGWRRELEEIRGHGAASSWRHMVYFKVRRQAIIRIRLFEFISAYSSYSTSGF